MQSDVVYLCEAPSYWQIDRSLFKNCRGMLDKSAPILQSSPAFLQMFAHTLVYYIGLEQIPYGNCLLLQNRLGEKKKHSSTFFSGMFYLYFHASLRPIFTHVSFCIHSVVLSLKRFQYVCCYTVAFRLLGPVNLRAFPFCALSSFSPPPLIPPRAVKSCLQAVLLPFHPVKGCVCASVCACPLAPSSHK